MNDTKSIPSSSHCNCNDKTDCRRRRRRRRRRNFRDGEYSTRPPETFDYESPEDIYPNYLGFSTSCSRARDQKKWEGRKRETKMCMDE